MTITPTPASPAALPGAAPEPAAPAGAAGRAVVPGDFLALVQQALTAALGGTPAAVADKPKKGAVQASAHASGQTPGKDTSPTGVGSAADTALAAAASGLVVVPVVPAPVTRGAAGAEAVTDGVAGVAGAASGGTTAGVAPAGPRATGPQAAGPAATGANAAAAPPAPHGTGHDKLQAQAPAATDAQPTTSQVAPDAFAAHPSGAEGGTSSDPGTGQQAQAAPTTPAVVPGTALAAPVTTVPAPQAAAPVTAPVTGQVFPEVTSLVSRGDGTHRITLNLKPEALGEVRVVMTMRDGAVHVRLAAGHEAQQALLAGSSELTRLLEHAGATDTRIVVRDLAGAAAPVAGSSNDRGADLGQAPGSGPGAGDARAQDQHAGTRAEHHATDGGHDSTTTAGTTPSRPVQPDTRTRTAGVDVSM